MGLARTFVIKNPDGEQLTELTVMFKKHFRTFAFPYATSDPAEIRFLLKQGAKEQFVPPPRQSLAPFKPAVPSKGGE